MSWNGAPDDLVEDVGDQVQLCKCHLHGLLVHRARWRSRTCAETEERHGIGDDATGRLGVERIWVDGFFDGGRFQSFRNRQCLVLLTPCGAPSTPKHRLHDIPDSPHSPLSITSSTSIKRAAHTKKKFNKSRYSRFRYCIATISVLAAQCIHRARHMSVF